MKTFDLVAYLKSGGAETAMAATHIVKSGTRPSKTAPTNETISAEIPYILQKKTIQLLSVVTRRHLCIFDKH